MFGCLLLECLACREAELFDNVCEPDALLALGVGVVKHTACGAHGHSSELSTSFLARGAEHAGFGAVRHALGEQAVVGAQSFATVRDANAAPRDGDALFLGGFCEFRGLLFSLGGFFGGFLGGSFFSLGCFFGGLLFSPGGFFGGFLVGILGGDLGEFASFFGGRFRGFLFSLLLSLFFLGQFDFGCLGGFGFFGGFGGLFFGFFGGSHLLDGVAVSVEFDDFGLGSLGGLGDGGMFLESECHGSGFEFSVDETTDRFAIEILTFAREHGNDDVDEFVTDLGSHVVRHFREALFHDGVHRESHGISGVHCFVIDV